MSNFSVLQQMRASGLGADPATVLERKKKEHAQEYQQLLANDPSYRAKLPYLERQAREERHLYELANPRAGLTGPLSRPFAGFFQALQNVAGDRDIKLTGGSSAPGSNQIRGQRVGVLNREPSDMTYDLALNNEFARKGLMGETKLRDELVRSQGSSRQAFEALMRALKND